MAIYGNTQVDEWPRQTDTEVLAVGVEAAYDTSYTHEG